ncbi:MAG: hypothetical protein ABI239_04360 [Aquihabitans sp.]
MKFTEPRDADHESAPVCVHPHVTLVHPADAQSHAWVLHSLGLIAEERALAVAEITANQPLLTPEQIAKVETAHHEVLEWAETAGSDRAGVVAA